MTDFAFTERVSDPHADIISAALHHATGTLNEKDVDKAVKLSANADSAYEICATNDELEGIIWASDTQTVNSGKRLGSILRGKGPVQAEVASDQGATPMAVGDLVVAGGTPTLNTKENTLVRTGAPTQFLWRCIRIISGAGAAGSIVLIERI